MVRQRLDDLSSAPRPAARNVRTATSTLYQVLAPSARLGWEIADLSDELSELFGRLIDLGSRRRSLHHLVRDEVLAEATVIYSEAA